jgi:thiol-disulfide isomerase/thioredoxin
LTPEKLRGRVVLVEFWTFGCSNCINTLPTMKSLDSKYRDKGLTIVGIETPELDFEKSFDGLEKAVKQRGIEYPVLTDYDDANWKAFRVSAWPTIFILDQDGRIRYEHIGEGAYDTEEKVIKTLMTESESGVPVQPKSKI